MPSGFTYDCMLLFTTVLLLQIIIILSEKFYFSGSIWIKQSFKGETIVKFIKIIVSEFIVYDTNKQIVFFIMYISIDNVYGYQNIKLLRVHALNNIKVVALYIMLINSK